MNWFHKPSIRQLLQAVITTQERIMRGVDDLKTAVSSLQTQVAAQQASINNSVAAQELILAEIATLKAAGGLSDADAETLSQTVNASILTLQTGQQSLDAETTKDGQN